MFTNTASGKLTFAGVAISGAGFFKSTDGVNWVDATGNLPTRQLQNMNRTTSSSGARTLYAHTIGYGIYRSTDDGASWSALNNGLQCLFPRSLQFLGTTATVFVTMSACGAQGGVYKSTDGGANWTRISNGLPDQSNIFQLVLADSAGQSLYASTGTDGIYASTDGGASWKPVNGTGEGALPRVNGEINVLGLYRDSSTSPAGLAAMVQGSGIFSSLDDGKTWTAVNTGLPGLTFTGIFSQTGNRLYVPVEGYGFYVATGQGAGANWMAAFSGLPKNVRSIITTGVADLLYATTYSGVYRSTDNGSTWQAANNGLPSGRTRSVTIDPGNPLVAYASADTVFKSSDGGQTWNRSDQGLAGATFATGRISVDPTNSMVVYVATDRAGPFKSTDSGATWNAANSGLPVGATSRNGYLVIDPSNSATLYLGTDGAGIFKSTNAGASWTAINNGLAGQALYAATGPYVDREDANRLLIGTWDGIYKSADGGASWTSHKRFVQSDGASLFPARFRTDTRNNTTIYVNVTGSPPAGGVYADNGVWRSADRGDTWTQILSGRAVREFRVTGTATAATLHATTWEAGGDLLRSTDDGANWTSAVQGLTNRYVDGLTPTLDRSRLAFAATDGGGVFANSLALRDEDRLYNWAEDNFPTFFLPKRPASYAISGYYARCYSGTGNCVGVKDGEVYYYDGQSIRRIGTLAELMAMVR